MKTKKKISKNNIFSFLKDKRGILPLIVAGAVLLFLFIMIATQLISSGEYLKNQKKGSKSVPTGGSLVNVPPGWNSIFEEAGKKIDLPPSIIATIYLTEHHATEFSEDIDPNGTEPDCTVSYAGATGPFQIMPFWWQGTDAHLVQNAPSWGLTVLSDESGNPYVDVCRYKDGAYGSAYIIKRQTDGNKGYTATLADEDVRNIARGYCGGCSEEGCGNEDFNYCEFALERYRSFTTNTAVNHIKSFFAISNKGALCKKESI